jgi:hypothetical protein
VTATFAQSSTRSKNLSVAILNTQNGYPFDQGTSLITGTLHPGFEVGINKARQRKKHDWITNYAASYFFHRYVQHAISVYGQYGYRYKFTNSFSSELSLGAGYLHSIPAVDKYKLDESGEYKKNKGVGCMQATVNLSLGARYHFGTNHQRNVFVRYQPSIQLPFVKAYVPLLPYNTLLIGVSVPFK